MTKAMAMSTIRDITSRLSTKTATTTMDIKRQARHNRTNKDRSSDKRITRVRGRGVLGMIRNKPARFEWSAEWKWDGRLKWIIRLGAFNNAL
jgi:hypothetical protein